MKIVVGVKTGSGENKVVKVDEGHYRVWVTAVPQKGEANKAVVKILADYFEVSLSKVRIVMGRTSKEKLIEVSK
jgi:hypothetical protein